MIKYLKEIKLIIDVDMSELFYPPVSSLLNVEHTTG